MSARALTGFIFEVAGGGWNLKSRDWTGPTRDSHGVDCTFYANGVWHFRRRVDAIAFAARRGIRLEET